LHEFGHAIGFEHEHQNALVPCDFRFEDEPGYVPTTDSFGQFMPDPHGKRPGLYTLLGGPPNNWPKAVVDFNLRPLPDSSAYLTGTFDKDSIMKYFFPEWMFIAGASSSCFSSEENLTLSAGDKQGAAKLYPREQQAINATNAVKTTVFFASDQIAGPTKHRPSAHQGGARQNQKGLNATLINNRITAAGNGRPRFCHDAVTIRLQSRGV
jgi:hypothetical protein